MNTLAAVAILAGGRSRRMGRDKTMLTVAGETLLHRTTRLAGMLVVPVLIVGRAAPENWDLPAARFISDDHPDCGPLGGVATALRTACGATLVVACDLPRLTAEALRWLADEWARCDTAAGLATMSGSEMEPLFAVYGSAALPDIARAIVSARRACHEIIATAGFARIELPLEYRPALLNCNTPEELGRE